MNDTVTESKFAMCRSAVGLAYADHKLTSDEKSLLHDIFEALPLTNEQQATLDTDLENNVDLNNHLKDITDKRDMGHLISFATVLFYSDDVYCTKEQAIYDEIHSKHMSTIDKSVFNNAREEAMSVTEAWAEENEGKELSFNEQIQTLFFGKVRFGDDDNDGDENRE